MPANDFANVYILVSENEPKRHYSGVTGGLKARLAKYNEGSVAHTANSRPWRIETAIAFASGEKARAFEGYLKSASGREFARRHF